VIVLLKCNVGVRRLVIALLKRSLVVKMLVIVLKKDSCGVEKVETALRNGYDGVKRVARILTVVVGNYYNWGNIIHENPSRLLRGINVSGHKMENRNVEEYPIHTWQNLFAINR